MYKDIFDAVKHNDIDRLKIILKKTDSKKIHEVVNENMQTPLLIATLNNNISMVSLLLEAGFDPNQKDITELSPFIGAASNGFTNVFEYMCLYKPDPNQYNRFGGTALIPSSEKGFLSTMQKALDYNVPVNYQNRLAWSALLEAVILGDGGYLFQDIIRELLEHQADVNLKDFENKSSLDYAKLKGQNVVLKMMENLEVDEFSPIRQLVRNSNYLIALKKINSIEDSIQKTFYLGLIYERLNEIKAAEYYYKLGLNKDIQFAFYLAQLYRTQNKVDEAIRVFNIDQNNEYLQYHLSNYLRELNRHDEAIIVMDRLLEKSPERVDYMLHKANSLRTLNQHENAYEEMVKAYNIMPNNNLFREHFEKSKQLILLRKEGEI